MRGNTYGLDSGLDRERFALDIGTGTESRAVSRDSPLHAGRREIQNDGSPSLRADSKAEDGIFATLPAGFFSPLACPNREHYAASLLAFYRSFQETAGGVERAVLVSHLSAYFAGVRAIADEPGLADDILEAETGSLFGDEGEAMAADDRDRPGSTRTARIVATRFVRNLVQAGWMSEETLPDYTRVLNIAPFAKPFLEALALIDEGPSLEYESHVVAVYSLLCGDAAGENGHYAVMNAHSHTVALNESLKVLSQSIRGHYERFFEASASQPVKELLRLHYDVYAGEVLDAAYMRLKTSDNLSRYRPRIMHRVTELLMDSEWLESSASKLARQGTLDRDSARRRLVAMLEEIRDTLRGVDPLLDEIDRRNMLYARTSVERIRALMASDATAAGRIAEAARAIRSNPEFAPMLAHGLHRVRVIDRASLFRAWLRGRIEPDGEAGPSADPRELERAEAELRLRVARQLDPGRVASWLDDRGGKEKVLSVGELAADDEDFVRLLYAVVYADGRRSFPYAIEAGEADRVRAGRYELPDLRLRRRA